MSLIFGLDRLFGMPLTRRMDGYRYGVALLGWSLRRKHYIHHFLPFEMVSTLQRGLVKELFVGAHDDLFALVLYLLDFLQGT